MTRCAIEERPEEDRRLEGDSRPDLAIEADLGLVHHGRCNRREEHRLEHDTPRKVVGHRSRTIVEIGGDPTRRRRPATRRVDRFDDVEPLDDHARAVDR
ncbi:MAG: hypothetical protein GY910_05780 [bacterium]|nr:hypothetical protein [bacterium]